MPLKHRTIGRYVSGGFDRERSERLLALSNDYLKLAREIQKSVQASIELVARAQVQLESKSMSRRRTRMSGESQQAS